MDTPVLTAAIGASAAILGGLFVGVVNLLNTYLQARNQRINEEFKHSRELHAETMCAYNSILKAHGESNVIIVDPGHHTIETLHVSNYRSGVRPAIFENFHLIGADLRRLAKRLDQHLSFYDYLIGIGDELKRKQAEDTLATYLALIHIVEKQYGDEEHY